MIGKDLFEDISIDGIGFEEEMRQAAHQLIDQWGKELTEGDLLRLSNMVQSNGTEAEHIIAAYALEYYLTKNYRPEFIHAVKTPLREKPWWKFW